MLREVASGAKTGRRRLRSALNQLDSGNVMGVWGLRPQPPEALALPETFRTQPFYGNAARCEGSATFRIGSARTRTPHAA